MQFLVFRLSKLLTPRRLAIYASLLASCLWSAYAIDLATPGLRDRAGNFKAADFLHFYTAATLIRNGRADVLYDPSVLAALQQKMLPQSAGTYFVAMYGPQVYLLFTPLATLPYGWAALIWSLLNCAIYAGCCYALWRSSPALKRCGHLVFLLAVAYPGFFSLIAFGQSSAPALVLFTLAFLALKIRQPFLAGLAIGCLIYKPQLGIAAAIVFTMAGEWRIIAGAAIAAATQLGLAWTLFGSEVLRHHAEMLLRLSPAQPFLEPKLYQMHSLRSFWMLLVPWRSGAMGLYLISAVAALAITVACWRKGCDLRLRYAALLFCTALVAPHLWIYDLVILVPAFVLTADWALESSSNPLKSLLGVVLYGCYVLPLLGPITSVIRLQLSVPAFAVCLWVLWSVIREPEPQTSFALPAGFPNAV